MRIQDEYIPDTLYAKFLARMPQACVELVLTKNDKILVAKRTNQPAKSEWFWPGGRLYKGETLPHAVHRIAKEELGIQVHIHEQLGIYNHFWETSPFDNVETTHTVNIVFHVTKQDPNQHIHLDNQHSTYKFITELEPNLHKYVKHYIRENNLLE